MELLRALAAVAEPLGPAAVPVFAALDLDPVPKAADYTECFTFARYPYASVYLDESGMLGGVARDRVAGYFRALGLEPPEEPDHLSILLATWAALTEREAEQDDAARRELLGRARRTLVREHLASWLPLYLDRFDEQVAPAYRRWATLLAELLAAALADGPGGDEGQLPRHFEGVPPLADPRGTGGADAFLASLLAPVRAGFILLPGDLTAFARALGTGSRIGERRYVLRALLDYDAAGTLRLLADHADRSAARMQDAGPVTAPVREFWARRAGAAATLLTALAAEAA